MNITCESYLSILRQQTDYLLDGNRKPLPIGTRNVKNVAKIKCQMHRFTGYLPSKSDNDYTVSSVK